MPIGNNIAQEVADPMKTIPITLNFDDTKIVGQIQLSDEAVFLLKIAPEHCITFAYNGGGMVNPETFEPLEKWEVVGAALTPNGNLPMGKYEDLKR